MVSQGNYYLYFFLRMCGLREKWRIWGLDKNRAKRSANGVRRDRMFGLVDAYFAAAGEG
jgi:hypothetical protein